MKRCGKRFGKRRGPSGRIPVCGRPEGHKGRHAARPTVTELKKLVKK